MKALTAAILMIGLATSAANARSVFDEIRDAAPRSVFEEIRDTAPRAPFDAIQDSAPQSDEVVDCKAP